jgi:cobalt-zinc-cadmium efflux system outer membrane protein
LAKIRQNFLHKLTLIGCLLSLIVAVDAHSESFTLSLGQVLAIFYQRNLDLIAAQYNIDQSRAEELIAGAIPNPSVGFQVSEITGQPNLGANALGCNPNKNVSCGPAEYFSFNQLIEVAGKRGLRIQSSGFATQAAESDFRDAERIFTNLVKDAYYNLLQMQKNQTLAQDITEHYQTILKANQLRLKSGDISESDFLRVKIEALKSQSELDAAQATVEQAQANLAVILRWPDKSLAFEVQEQWPDIQNIGQNQAKEDLIDTALKQRPDLEADKQRVAQAEKELALAKRLNYPDVSVTAGYARDPSNNNLDTGFIGFSVPLPLFYQHQGETSKASVNLNQNRLALAQTELSIRNDVVGALATWQSADKIVHRYQEGILDDALVIRNSAELAYSKGATTVLDFIDAQRNYKTIMRDYNAAMVNRSNAYFDLAKALGTSLDATPATPPSEFKSAPTPLNGQN